MYASDVNIVDIRDEGSYAEGHIDKAHHVNEVNIKDFVQNTCKDKPLICYCYHGISSQGAAGFFAAQGFKKVFSLDGGFEKWKSIHGQKTV